jgi:very-short-patch-repair endonuclease
VDARSVMLVRVLIEELPEFRGGVLTRDQALRGGLTLRQVQQRIRTGRWMVLHPGVYLVGRREPDQQACTRAAVAWAGSDAVASGLTAAWWWGLRDCAPGAAEVTVPRARSRRRQEGVVLRRRQLDPVDLVVLRGLQVTALPLTVLDAAAALGNDSGRPLVDRALQRRVSFAELHAAYCRSSGRHGSPWLGQMLRQAADGASSDAERVLHRLLRGARIDGWVANHLVAASGIEYWIDVAFVARRLALEVDGWAWHCDVDRFVHDRRRQNALVLAGWTVLRFTWQDLMSRPHAVVAEIRAALRNRSRFVCRRRHGMSPHAHRL